MGDVNEEKVCCQGQENVECNCEGTDNCECEAEVVAVRPDHWANVQEYWDTVHDHLNQAASDVHNAVSKGLTAAEPVFREKVAPVLADATAKLSELADTARKTTSEKAGFAEDEKTPVEHIGAGLAGVATGLLGLSKSLAEWLSAHATAAAEKDVKDVEVDEDVITVPDENIASDVTAVADLLNQPVYVADGDIAVVEPNS